MTEKPTLGLIPASETVNARALAGLYTLLTGKIVTEEEIAESQKRLDAKLAAKDVKE